MEFARAQARIIKSTNALSSSTEITPANEWFDRPSNAFERFVSYDSIAEHADHEFQEWCTLDSRITTLCTFKEKMDEWIRTTTEDEISQILCRVPSGIGCPGAPGTFDYTPWQRLSMAFYYKPFFSIEVSIHIDTPVLREIAQYQEHETGRKMPLVARMSILDGTCRDVGIVNLPTAGGKTSWVLTTAFLITHDQDALEHEYHDKLKGTMIHGPSTPKIARLVLVACSASTFDHFSTTLSRLIDRLAIEFPDVTIHLWNKMSKTYSTQRAYEMTAEEEAIVYWVVDVGKLNHVMRQCPDITVPVVVVDEYTDTPRQKYKVDQSMWLKFIIAQATPQALQTATCGNHSILKEVMGGGLIAPKHLARCIRHRTFNEAELAARQYCKLQLMMMTPFRPLVRQDLIGLVPIGFNVTFIRSRRVTISSRILGSESDMVPASFENVVLSSLRNFGLTDASRTALQAALRETNFTPAELVAVLDRVESTYVGTYRYDRGPVQRLQERITECATACPICMSEDQTSIRIFGCCSYTVCIRCYESLRAPSCPFCRVPIRNAIPLCEVTDESAADTAQSLRQHENERQLDEAYPSILVDFNPSLMRRNNQVTNLTLALHKLRMDGKRRTLIIIERPAFSLDFSLHVQLDVLQQRTQFTIHRVDGLLTGKGTAFTKIKRDFDAPSSDCKAILCFGMNESLLYGTDLAMADSVITVGRIGSDILSQAVNRTFRPRAGRDNSQPMPFIKIYSSAPIRGSF